MSVISSFSKLLLCETPYKKWRELPNELWDEVLEFVSVQDRVNYMMVSKDFAAIGKNENYWSKIIREKLDNNSMRYYIDTLLSPGDYSYQLISYNNDKSNFQNVAYVFSTKDRNALESIIRHIGLSRLGLSSSDKAYDLASNCSMPGAGHLQACVLGEYVINNDLVNVEKRINEVEKKSRRDDLKEENALQISYIRHYCKEGKLKEAIEVFEEHLDKKSMNCMEWFWFAGIIWIHLDSLENSKLIAESSITTVDNILKSKMNRGAKAALKVIHFLAEECYTPSQIKRVQEFARKYEPEVVGDNFDSIQFNILIKDYDEAWKMTLKLPLQSQKRKDSLLLMSRVFRRAGMFSEAEVAAKYLNEEYAK